MVQQTRQPEKSCHCVATAFAVVFGVLFIGFIVWAGYSVGRNSGWQDGYHRGYTLSGEDRQEAYKRGVEYGERECPKTEAPHAASP